MMFPFFRRRARGRLIERLHGEIVAAARQRALYTDLAIPDTFEGRFEALVLHACLVLRRLRALEAPAPHLAQEVIDAIFAHFDSVLREAGIGDPAVPKRMKKLAEAFYGRVAAYTAALDGEGPAQLEAALLRNVYGGEPAPESIVGRLAAYVRRAEARLAAYSTRDFLEGPIGLPDPAAAA